jgi:hypothetical protein
VRKSPAVFHTEPSRFFTLSKVTPGDFGVKQSNPDLRVLDAAFRESIGLLTKIAPFVFLPWNMSGAARQGGTIDHRGWLRPRDTCLYILSPKYHPYPFQLLVTCSHLCALFGCASELRAKQEVLITVICFSMTVVIPMSRNLSRGQVSVPSMPRILAVVLGCNVGNTDIAPEMEYCSDMN